MRVTFEDLEVCEEVGRGGFGVVYRGIIRSSGLEVAIKQIDLEELPDLDEISNEIAIISECRHPNITLFLGCFVRNYRLWVIMEYVDGGLLHDLLKPAPVTDEATIALVVRELLAALAYLHGQGKIHRDLKLQNILILKAGEVKLTDFGVSTQLSSSFSRRNTTVGTPYWMAPEVINNSEGHLFKADVWLLGCCAYEMVTGKPPLQETFPPMKALRQISRCHDFVSLIDLDNLAVLALFRDFLRKCFVVAPAKRWSATQLLKHRWLTCTGDPVSIKKLVTAKQLWDQEHPVDKVHNFYVPTEIAANQRKWQLSPDDDDGIQFDISTVNLGEAPDLGFDTPGDEVQATSTIKQPSPTNEPGPQVLFGGAGAFNGIATDVVDSPVNELFSLENHRAPLIRVLNKVFHKMETRCALLTQQYDLLVKLNDTIVALLLYLDLKKVVVFHYLKYFLRELTKPQNGQLAKLIIPLQIRVGGTRLISPEHDGLATSLTLTFGSRHTITEFDEVEYSLFESWISKMKKLHNVHS